MDTFLSRRTVFSSASMAGMGAVLAMLPGEALSKNSDLAAFKAAIRAKYDLKERAFSEHDAETVVNRFYSEDVISTGNDERVQIGRSQLLPLYRKVVQNSTVKVVSFFPFVSGDAGWDWTDFHVTPTDDAPFTFKILFLWKRIGKEWFCAGDMYFKGSFADDLKR
jgi:hypothetical protein